MLDTEPEAEFNSIVEAAAGVCGMPMCALALFDGHRYWFKASVGMPGLQAETHEASFCAHGIEHDGLLEISDCLLDAQFANNPYVVGQPHIRFYAGHALSLEDGTRVGTMCVMDTKPAVLSDMQRLVFTHLSNAASRALDSRQIARTLAARELQFHSWCESSPLGVFSVDMQGRFKYGNKRLLDLFGLNADSTLEIDWQQTVHPDDLEQVAASWCRALEDKVEVAQEFRVVHKDKSVLTLAGILRPVVTDDRPISFVGSVEDITAQKHHQEQQNRSLSLMRQTGALAGVGGWELDLRTQKVFWTEQTRLIHGVAPDYNPDLESAIAFFVPEDRPVIRDTMTTLAVDGNKIDRELRLCRPDGRILWVRVRAEADMHEGKIFRLCGAVQDIDDIVRQRQALENAHDRITIATESGEIGVWEWEVDSGHIDWTPQMYKLYGVEVEGVELTLDNWMAFIHPDDAHTLQGILAKAIEGPGDLDCEFRIVNPDGTVRHLRSCAHIKRDINGRALTLLGVNWDVTAVRELTSKLAEQHELLHVTLQSIDDAVITTDIGGRVRWLNPAAESMTAWTCADALGKSLEEVYRVADEESGLPLENPLVECLRLGKPIHHSRDGILLAGDGTRYGIEESAAPILDAQQKLLGVVLVFRDVTEQRRMRTAMKHRATHDELTQVLCRSEFEARLRKTLNSLRDAADSHALLFIDLDEFKLVNDACGHPVGDQLLRQIADLLNESLREGDTLARLGGDEFGVILSDCDTEQAHTLARDICRRLGDFRFAHGSRRFRVGASIGLVPLDDRWASPAAVMQAADTSCYAAKEAGRNRVHVWYETDQAMRARRGDMQWAARLEQSLDENCFELYAQRLVSLVDDGAGLSAEVLIRLRCDEGEIVLPGAFLPAAERYHLATRIDRWVLQKAIRTLTELSSLDGVERLWINVSGQSVGDREFHRDAIEMFRKAGSEVCQRICLEITETTAVTNICDAAHFIISLRELNVHTALDDFGAGASSFGYLKSLPVDVIKIDGQFIDNLIDNPLNAAAVRCFVDVAGVMGLQTVAEFVETTDALEYVKDMGVDYAQGFLLHKPEPIGRLLDSALGVRDRVAM